MEKSLKEKIRKLIALQEGAQKIGSLEEAANAAEKIRALLLKHNLDLYTIQKEGQEEQTEKATFDTGSLSTKVEGDWVRHLAEVIARHHLCTIIGTGKARSFIYIIGKPSNTEVTWYTVEQLVNRIRPMAKAAFSEYRGGEKRNTFIRGFLMGAVNGIAKQLAERAAKEAYQAKKDREADMHSQSTALMTLNMMAKHKADNEAFVKKNFNVTTSRARTTSSISGRVQGTEAGYKMGINPGVKSGSSIKGNLN